MVNGSRTPTNVTSASYTVKTTAETKPHLQDTTRTGITCNFLHQFSLTCEVHAPCVYFLRSDKQQS
ncbi:hypothetical protein PISMIDRAFT_675357 [Pisolithus microcarpus 441]|uniref:Uncharacterized protein n=1 Tax=Pisolithus microcarpus 441 TaxID=765257 RepID=A0A0C9YPT8_9AGAM|nr:hypothetical protein PISMIDRAFT_675357 [Pisolithus microcarpus 441]